MNHARPNAVRVELCGQQVGMSDVAGKDKIQMKKLDLNNLISKEVWQTDSVSSNILAEGVADLQVDFGSNQVSGAITFNQFYDGDLWVQEGGGCSGSQIFGLDPLELQVSGTISNGDITASVSINQTDASDGQITAGAGTVLTVYNIAVSDTDPGA